ncbi:MAG: hypothetical protein J1G06_05245 [Oscillospiraceae bacterium]|nr:hypothetical protein [Oscillospiraceae bacterium]
MTLLITLFAAIASTIVWYTHPKSKLRLGTLSLMFWGASLMWLVDAVVEYFELKAEYFTPAAADMLNDAFLGLSVIALGLTFWLTIVLIKDPNGVLKNSFMSKE